jgi:hypothetical protein
MPNIATCNSEWNRKQIQDQEEVVVVAWSNSLDMNKITEKLADLETETKMPIFVCDMDSCAGLADGLGLRPGEVAVFKSGKEVGRVASSTNVSDDISKIRKITGR